MLNKIREVPLYSAAFSFLIWLAGTDLLLILIDNLFTFPLALMLGFGFIYPVGATAIFFLLSKRHGVLWYFPAAVILTSSLHMIFWSAYRIMVPNILIMTTLCLLFGCGIGGCFADKEAVRAYRERQKQKRLGEDKPYTPILETKNNNDKIRK